MLSDRKKDVEAMRRRDSIGDFRRRHYEILERGSADDRASLLFHRCIVTLIVVNLTAVALESMPSLAGRYGVWFDVIEYGSLVAFTAEYACGCGSRSSTRRTGICRPARRVSNTF